MQVSHAAPQQGGPLSRTRALYHIFLDLDGTLTDPGRGIAACFAHAAHSLGVEISGDPGRFVGPPLRDSFRDILDSNDPAQIDRAVSLYRERFATKGIFENAVYPGIPAALHALQTMGHPMAVVTSKPKPFADRIIDHFELAPYFSAVYGPSLDGEPATKSELLAQVLGEERVRPSNACMVGDRSYDMVAATHNGVTGVGVEWGYGTPEELKAAGASVLIESVDALVSSISDIANV